MQGQLVGQFNLNAQLGLAFADADAGEVEVNSWQDPSLGNGIVATSSAFAGADLEQDVHQKNENSASIELPALQADADPTSDGRVFPLEVAAQLEGVLQANLSLQAGASVAEAESSNATVFQGGGLTAQTGDGIDATSEAIAKADLEQKARQENEDSKEISRDSEGGDETDTVQPATIAAQLEAVIQANASLQLGVAVADAQSGDVDVKSFGELEAGEDGINAEFEGGGHRRSRSEGQAGE